MDRIGQALGHLRAAFTRITEEEVERFEIALLDDEYGSLVVDHIIAAARLRLAALADERLATIETRLRHGSGTVQ